MIVIITTASFFIACIIIIYSSVKITPESEEYVVLRFGKFKQVLKPGLNIIFPFIDTVAKKVSMMERAITVDNIMCISKDNAHVSLKVIIFLQIVNSRRSVFAVSNIEQSLEAVVSTAIRSACGQLDVEEILANRDLINQKISTVIEEVSERWGIKARIEVLDIDLPKELKDAMSLQLRGDRERRYEIIKANSDKEAEIIRSEGRKKSEINISEGEKLGAINRAIAREREAEAESKAIQVINSAISEGKNSQLGLNYSVALRYAQSLTDIASKNSSRLIMMPLESSSFISSLAGISELFNKNETTELPELEKTKEDNKKGE